MMLHEKSAKPRPRRQYEGQAQRIARRNADLLARFLFLYEEKRMRYDDCLGQVAHEFYLSERTTTDLVARLLKAG